MRLSSVCQYALCLMPCLSALAQQSQLTYSYVLATNLNVVPVQPGGTITFPPTLLNTVAQATLNITNNGGATAIQNLTISGSAFALQALPSLPVTLQGGQTLQILIRYQPSGATTDTGAVQVTSALGTDAFKLQGAISAARFVYTLIEGTQSTTVTPGSTITVSDTKVGDTSSVVLQVKNAGNLTGQISSINLSGSDYRLAPLLLPQVLAPGAAFTLSLSFSPSQPGTRVGSLYIGSDAFALAGNGLGPKLVYSYTSVGTTVTVGAANPDVVFSPVMITESESVQFVIANQGTSTATIFSIGVAQANSPFSVSGLPPLPLQLASNAQASFKINFIPTTMGFSAANLLVDTTTIGLLGSATAPPPLPAYSIGGPSGHAEPMTQTAVSLKLSSPYPVAIAGVMTLDVSSNLPADPAVQFSTGGRTADFTIPANTTDAVFTGQGTQMQLQIGTVASTISLTPSFATAGGVNLTPANPATLEFTIAPSAPTLTGIQVSSLTANSFVLAVTGFSTTRSLTALNAQFTTAPGFSLAAGPVTVDLGVAAPAWFSTNQSIAFGGGFVVQVPFNLSGTVPSGQTLLSALSSISVTVSSQQGTSNSLDMPLK